MSELIESAHLWAPGVAAMLCLIVVSGFFSSSETALFYLSRDELRRFRVGKPRERLAAELLRNADRLLTAILFWNLVTNLTYFAVSVVVARRLGATGNPAAAGLFGIFSLFGIILFGEVLPKSVAVVFRRPLASLVSWPLAVSVRVLDPVTPVLRRVTRIVRQIFWPHITREPYLEAEDLERAVEASRLSDDVIRQERQVLHNVLDLSEIPAEEVMRPRGAYFALAAPIHLSDLKGEVPPSNYVMVRMPDSEDIEAAVPLASFASIPERHLEQAAEEVVYVPWCAKLAYTLQVLRDRLCSVAVVVNEYGETIGIVTYEDIIDTFLMPQPSRAKRILQREPVLEIAPGRYHVEGITTLRYLCTRLGIDYDPTSDALVTVSGLLYELLERIPEAGDECFWRDYHVKVIDVSRRGHLRAMISVREPEPEDEGAE